MNKNGFFNRKDSMKITVTLSMFEDAFQSNPDRRDSFSREALGVIYERLIELETCGFEWELDIVEVCCTYNEIQLDDEIGLLNYSEFEPIAMLTNSVLFGDH